MMRDENDSLGTVQVPKDKYWGAQTERSLKHFSIGDDLIPKEMIQSMGIIKKGAALANHELGILPKDKMELIIKAAEEVIEGKLNAHFPIHAWTTVTQLNMNVNEVISNRAIEIAKGTMGSKTPIHPNDHVNMSQSSNDTFPSGMCIAALLSLKRRLLPSIEQLHSMLEQKSKKWEEVIKIGRTHMQDAVPLTLGQEFSGYSTLIEENILRIKLLFQELSKLAIGGTAVGTGLNTPKGFANLISEKISQLTENSFSSAPNKFAVQGSHDAFIATSGALKTLACSLYKIANDIRLLSCGPRTGFHEILIPANEPGSSIMPGKVNPTQCDVMTMVATQVMGYDTATTFASAAGSLELNVCKPMIIFNILKSINMLSDSSINFTKYLLKDIQPNLPKIKKYIDQSLMLVTALSPIIGYDKASQLAHYANDNNCSLKEANNHFKFVSDEEFKKIIDPKKMAHPHG